MITVTSRVQEARFELQPLVIATAMFSLLTRRVATGAVRTTLRTAPSHAIYKNTAASRTFFAARVLADPTAKDAPKEAAGTKKAAAKKPKKAVAKPKPKKVKKVVPPAGAFAPSNIRVRA